MIELTLILIALLLILIPIKHFYDKYQNLLTLFNSLLTEIDAISSQYDKQESKLLNYDKKIDSLQFNLEFKSTKIKTLEKKIQEDLDAFALKESLLIKDFEKKLSEQIEITRKDTIKRSRSIIRGQATEHLAPFIVDGVNPKDCRFLGSPVDYIVFDGLSAVTDKTQKTINEIKFIDIKTGKSSLNTAQRRIRDAIKEGKVTFQIVNPEKNNETD